MEDKNKMISLLLDVGVVKFGEFILKSGGSSPIYIDLRGVIHYPQIIKDFAQLIWAEKVEKGLEVDVICGVPYTALPIASALSILQDMPLVMKRKEVKNYGTKRMVEGVIKQGQKCLIVEDVVSSGASIVETAEALRQEGLVVTDCIVIMNRKQGGDENVAKRGITLHSLFEIDSVVATLCSMNALSADMEKKVKTYFKDYAHISLKEGGLDTISSFSERKETSTQPVAKKLFSIIEAKQTNLCVAVDTVHSAELLELADKLGPHICMLKTHIDILDDFSAEVPCKLRNLANKHNFIIFEDRKFADIGNTVKYQYGSGLYRINTWADIVTVHSLPGSGIIDALKSVSKDEPRACVLIAQMSSKGALTSEDYVKKTVEMAEKHADFVIGFISQHRLSEKSNFIHMCPGVSLESAGDAFGQQYKTPEDAIVKSGNDVIIVGRGVTEAKDVVKAAEEYKLRAFKAYQSRLSIM